MKVNLHVHHYGWEFTRDIFHQRTRFWVGSLGRVGMTGVHHQLQVSTWQVVSHSSHNRSKNKTTFHLFLTHLRNKCWTTLIIFLIRSGRQLANCYDARQRLHKILLLISPLRFLIQRAKFFVSVLLCVLSILNRLMYYRRRVVIQSTPPL